MARVQSSFTPFFLAWILAFVCVTVQADDTPYLRVSRVSKDSTQKVHKRSTNFEAGPNPLLSRAFNGLLGRQISTCDAGEYSCGDGYCCDIGRTCYPNSCCLPGEQECAVASCFDPSLEVCCGDDGTTCDVGYDCVGTDSCCTTGRIPCSDDYCYNPDSEICCADGSVCDAGTECGSSSCVGSGSGGGGGIILTTSTSSTRTTSFNLDETTTTTRRPTSTTAGGDDEDEDDDTTTTTTRPPRTPTPTTTTTTGGANHHGPAPMFVQVADFVQFALGAAGMM